MVPHVLPVDAASSVVEVDLLYCYVHSTSSSSSSQASFGLYAASSQDLAVCLWLLPLAIDHLTSTSDGILC